MILDNNYPFQLHAGYDPSLGGYHIYILGRTSEGSPLRGVLHWEERHEATYSPPTLFLRPEEAQQLFNELWHTGLRPQEGAGSVAEADALRSHISDLRRIAFKLLDIEGKS